MIAFCLICIKEKSEIAQRNTVNTHIFILLLVFFVFAPFPFIFAYTDKTDSSFISFYAPLYAEIKYAHVFFRPRGIVNKNV